ncbi:MAG: 4-alpha-glucanotransferase [Treponema sp.]|jgi:4-alpha-glucanotransferase|nr:4-alpha-glucanotransferase [Treponema sp.]
MANPQKNDPAKDESKDEFSERLIGAVVPLGALRGSGSTGVGEFPDLVEFAGLCVKMGVGLIQLLPVNDTGYQSSPYFALTVFALHPLYLRIADLPEAGPFAAKIRALGERFDKDARFAFEPILKAKIGLLREIYAANKAEIAAKAGKGGGLGVWIEENPWVKEYAVFRRLKEINGERGWKEWSSHQQIDAGEIESLWNDEKIKDEHLFWVWLQQALDAQFSRAAKAVADMGILLEGDLPILINEDSADVWAHPEYFNRELSAGAPPDMYSPEGQRWGFPTYRWDVLEKNDYDWWRKRLKVAEKYYKAYRIDHVLGFFRIWTSSQHDNTSVLGWFNPYVPVTKKDLLTLNFDEGRIRWVTRPHIPTGELWDALRSNWGGGYTDGDIAAEAERAFTQALDRIGEEELWLFKDSITSEQDIIALNLHHAAQGYLVNVWHNRLFVEYEKGNYFPTWLYRNTRAYASFSETEKKDLETLVEKHRADSEKIWEKQGQKLLAMLKESTSMLPCAEDLGAVPGCVPRVLAKLKILGLRVVRWHRDWKAEGEPYYPFEDYPELSVCTPAVHDSSTLREWWDKEAEQEVFSTFIGVPALPKIYNPGAAKIILHKIAAAASRYRVFQIQDLLHLSPRWYAGDPASERINVPGTLNEFNWTYRLPASIADIAKDADLLNAVRELADIKPAKKAKGKR